MGEANGHWRVTLISCGWGVAGMLETKKEAEILARVFRELFDWSDLTSDRASRKAFADAHLETMKQVRGLLPYACRKTALQGARQIMAELKASA